MLKYQAIFNKHFSIRYLRYGVTHRKKHPARICYNGEMGWYEYGQLHRKDSPAVIYTGRRYYWIRGIRIC